MYRLTAWLCDSLLRSTYPTSTRLYGGQHYGRELLDLYIASRLRIINSRTRPDNNKGAFTCFTPRGASVHGRLYNCLWWLYKLCLTFSGRRYFIILRPLPIVPPPLNRTWILFPHQQNEYAFKEFATGCVKGDPLQKKRVVLIQVGYLCFIPLMFR